MQRHWKYQTGSQCYFSQMRWADRLFNINSIMCVLTFSNCLGSFRTEYLIMLLVLQCSFWKILPDQNKMILDFHPTRTQTSLPFWKEFPIFIHIKNSGRIQTYIYEYDQKYCECLNLKTCIAIKDTFPFIALKALSLILNILIPTFLSLPGWVLEVLSCKCLYLCSYGFLRVLNQFKIWINLKPDSKWSSWLWARPRTLVMPDHIHYIIFTFWSPFVYI